MLLHGNLFPREIVRSRDFLAAVERDLPRVAHLPTLILWCDRDIAFREAERRWFEQIFPRHRTVILRGAGHYIQEDAAADIVEAIRQRWGRTSSGRTDAQARPTLT